MQFRADWSAESLYNPRMACFEEPGDVQQSGSYVFRFSAASDYVAPKSASGKGIAIAPADNLADANKAGSACHTPVGAKAREESLRIHFFVIWGAGFAETPF
jgi:hypothetical protein